MQGQQGQQWFRCRLPSFVVDVALFFFSLLGFFLRCCLRVLSLLCVRCREGQRGRERGTSGARTASWREGKRFLLLFFSKDKSEKKTKASTCCFFFHSVFFFFSTSTFAERHGQQRRRKDTSAALAAGVSAPLSESPPPRMVLRSSERARGES